MLIGFADNINLLTYSTFTEVNCINLEQGYSYCLDWARTHGMHFSPSKYQLTHFTRRRGFNLQAPIQIGDTLVRPEPSIKILGLQLDSKLNWLAQGQAIRRKMKTQILALQQVATSTWGATMPKARLVYQAVI